MHSRGVSGVWFPGKDWYNALPFIWENGGEVAVEMDGKWDAQFSSPESQAGIKQVQEIMTKGSTAPKDGDERDAWVPLRTEKAATLSAPSWAYWSIIADEDKKDTALITTLGYFNLPGKDGGVASVFAGGSNIGISAKSANPELAQKALEIIMSEEYQTILAEGGLVPARTSLSDKVAAATPELTMLLGVAIAVLMTKLGAVMRTVVSVGLLLAWSMPALTATIVWGWIFDTSYGLVNHLLTRVTGDNWMGTCASSRRSTRCRPSAGCARPPTPLASTSTTSPWPPESSALAAPSP